MISALITEHHHSPSLFCPRSSAPPSSISGTRTPSVSSNHSATNRRWQKAPALSQQRRTASSPRSAKTCPGSSFERTSSRKLRVYSASSISPLFAAWTRRQGGASGSYTRPVQPFGRVLEMATALGSAPVREKFEVFISSSVDRSSRLRLFTGMIFALTSSILYGDDPPPSIG